jgi:hypothetical protein
LSIVNGSFVTLGKALNYCGRNIKLRDTMFLAPPGSQSLVSLGKLYGEGLHKISLNQEELGDMNTLLNRDKIRFIQYAIRDALVSLAHAT